MKIDLVPQSQARRSSVAYTTVETVFAIAVVALMFVSLYGGMSGGFAVTQLARENLRATQIMLERMEGIRLFTYDQLTNTSLNPLTFTNYYYPLASKTESKGIAYKGTVTVSSAGLFPPATSEYSGRIRAVQVQVKWTSGGVQRTRTMTTYSARNGVQNYIYSN